MKRILLLLGLFIVAFLEIRQVFNFPSSANSNKRIEVTKEATTTGKITAGEMARVASVIDGDTIDLTDGRRVRYIGIDAPETAHEGKPSECFGNESKEENKRWVVGKTVRLEIDVSATDAYGRLLRYVYVGDTMVNEMLVIGGFARAWNVLPDEKQADAFLAAQFEAREMSRGLWGLCR